MQYDERWHLDAPARASGVVILNDRQEVLLVQERKPGLEGLWHLPSGSVEADETADQTAVREAHEETGLQVRLTRFLNAYVGRMPSGALIVRTAWLAEATGGTLKPVFDQEIADARWFSRAEVEQLSASRRLRMHHTRLFLEDAYRLTGAAPAPIS
ncbi:NUDIX domain-containing protein [Deinococcus sonorensis]|uniref:NUDIX domain-containing protein n=2 Tax=Deinococcus sonorensis TaxID=309891 RepID=A0AAU7UDE2_9DEIO